MSSTPNSDSTQEQRDENTLTLPSPIHNEVENFDNESTYPDLTFFVRGMEKPLHLHRTILVKLSEKMSEIFRHTSVKTFEWPDDTTNEIDRNALVKALRFCYGETMIVGTENGECCAMIAALTRLQVKCLDEVVVSLRDFTVKEAKRDVFVGAELLKACVKYKECCGMNQCTLNQELAKIVLTKENMFQHFREVVDGCLMLLPPEYLTLAEFSQPHSKCSEFCLRARYMRKNPKTMTTEEKEAFLGQCNWSKLNSDELRELRYLDIIDRDHLLEAYEKALEYCEMESTRANERADKAEREKDERVKQAERDRDEKVEKVKKEKEEYQKQLETMQVIIRGNRL